MNSLLRIIRHAPNIKSAQNASRAISLSAQLNLKQSKC